ncbi:MAG: penicillin-binding transpeptidase domain-containing protein [Planctomycetaceae bacterium]|nr:hypothetical protein [Planctomycetaceae bacterium]
MYKFRIKCFMVLAAVVFLAIVARLVHLQGFSSEDYREQAGKMLTDVKMLSPVRGLITDRNGKVLADNLPWYELCLEYGLLSDDEAFYEKWFKRQRSRIVKEEKVSSERATTLLRQRIHATWARVYQIGLSNGMDRDAVDALIERTRRRVNAIRDAARISPVLEQYQAHPVVPGMATMVDTQGMIGASVVPRLKRHYPYGALACHVIGLTGQVNDVEMRRLNLPREQGDDLERLRRNYRGGDIIGKRGVEKMCEEALRGNRGYRKLDRRTGEPLEDGEPAIPGAAVKLTIDIDLQRELTDLLASTGSNGSIAVVSVQTGQVLAMVSWPTFDLNEYGRQYSKLVKDDLNFPLHNRAVTRLYPPGSTLKPLSGLAALQLGLVQGDTQYECRGYLINPSSFRCWIWPSAHIGHGMLDVVGALQHSCNVFFYHAGELVTAERLVDWYRQWGLGDVAGTGLPEESRAQLPSASWLNRHPGPGAARLMGIGQGPVVVTPMHVANYMGAIARRGEFVSPSLVVGGAAPQARRRIGVDARYISLIQEGMYKVVNDSDGTSYDVFHRSVLAAPEVEVCGKTGTATVPPQRWQGMSVRQGDMAWFAGYAPRENPQISFAVVVEYVVGGGSRNAGPLARELVKFCCKRGYVNQRPAPQDAAATDGEAP